MKLKRLPEDFHVEEITSFTPQGGSFALYTLTKRSIGTPEAVDAIARTWNVPRRLVGYGGLKDKHALTRQFLTIKNGLRQNLVQKGIELIYVGQAARPFGPQDITGNRFAIVMRDMTREELDHAVQALTDVAADGLPNYFDDQRFGSVGESREFIAAPWCLGNYERALWLALADPNEVDQKDEREQKQILRDLWGKWTECKAALARSHRRSIVTYLDDHPTDFRGALARVRVDLRGLYLAAFQSHLWNRMLAALIRKTCTSEQIVDVPLKMGPVPFPRDLSPEQRDIFSSTGILLPSARSKHDAGEWQELLLQILSDYGLDLRQLRVKYPRDSFFSKGTRKAFLQVTSVGHEVEDDDLYPQRQKLTLRYDLPRGAYATILIKRLTDA